MKLGVFDSGVGGLSVLKSLLEAKLFDSIVYYGDTARVPYGTKDSETIKSFCLQSLDFFLQNQVDMLVIACNTASAYALDSLQNKAPFPVIGVITPGVIATSNKLKDKNSQILVIATKATIKSNIYAQQLELAGFYNVKSLPTGLFVAFVEDGILSGALLEQLCKHYFKDINAPSAVILGCTHFPLIANTLQQYFGEQTLLIHSGEAIVEYICANFHIPQNQELKHLQFHASDDTNSLKNTAKLWLGPLYHKVSP